MELVPSDRERGLETPVWAEYEAILSRAGCTVREGWGAPVSPGISAHRE